MEELLSLKWNNHRNSFNHLLSTLRRKNTYSDVTLACDGQLYNVHKMVLSACSDYFSSIFENISCSNPVIVLKDMPAANLESLLDYMYVGEVSVRQCDLSSLIQAAECLRLKGLAVSEEETGAESVKKRSSHSPPTARKKVKKSSTENPTQYDKVDPEEHTIFERSPIDSELPANMSTAMKTEDVVTIKDEFPSAEEEYIDTWGFNADATVEPVSFDPKEQIVQDANQFDTIQTSFTSDTFTDTEKSNTEMPPFDNQSQLPSSSQNYTNIPVNSPRSITIFTCCYCKKQFNHRGHYRDHTRIHTGEKPFPCPHCPYRASQKGTLVTHVYMRHPEK